ncbi:MAG: hypothetical protein ACLP8A_01195 [Methylovirgula sp.]
MTAVKDLIEDWIVVRSTLVRQLELLKSADMPSGTLVCDVTTETTVVRVEACIRELNALLKDYARAPIA